MVGVLIGYGTAVLKSEILSKMGANSFGGWQQVVAATLYILLGRFTQSNTCPALYEGFTCSR